MRVLFIHKPISVNVENTVQDCINAFANHSKLSVELISFDEFNENQVVLENYDCLCLYKFHFTKENSLPLFKKIEIRNFKGVKAVFLEEEYFILYERIQNIIFMGIKLVFTALPEKVIEKIYGPYKEHFNIIKVFHGYINDRYRSIELINYEKRVIDLSYRALNLPYFYGCLGMEKTDIGVKSLKYFKKYNLNLDISNHYKDRLWGDQWSELLKNSKAVLGVECGSGVVDFGSSFFHYAIEYQRKRPNSSFQEVEELFFKGLDGKYDISGISPRIFEYAALKNLMILFEGDYEYILEPNYHYLSLKKDFSNVKEIIETIKNPQKAKSIINNAYQDIALNNSYYFNNYVKIFDTAVVDFKEKLLSSKNIDMENDNRSSIINNTAYDGKYISLPKNLSEENISRGYHLKSKSKYLHSIVRKIIVIVKNKLNSHSYMYTYLGKLFRKARNFNDFLVFCIEVFKQNKGILLFLCLLPKYEQVASLSRLAKHIRERERLFKGTFLTTRTYGDFCEIIYSDNQKLTIQLHKIINLLINHGNINYLVTRLDMAWKLSDSYRTDIIYQISQNKLTFLKFLLPQDK